MMRALTLFRSGLSWPVPGFRHLLVLVGLFFSIAPALAVECSQLVNGLRAQQLDGTIIRTAQQQLIKLGYTPGDVDGQLGSKTRFALALFCGDARYAVKQDDLVETLRNHVKIAAHYPKWRTILASEPFTTWMRRQQDIREILHTRDAGSADQVIDLLRRFDSRALTETAKASVPTRDALVSFTLSEGDFSLLRSRERVLEQLGKLLSVTYGGKFAFEAAAEQELKGVPEYQQYIQLAEEYGRQLSGHQISEESFKELKTTEVPGYVLEPLQEIQGNVFPGKELDVAVQQILDGLRKRAMDFKPEVVKYAQIAADGASLTDVTFSKFAEAHPDDALAAEVLARLEDIKGKKYQNDKSLAWMVKTKLMEIETEIAESQDTIMEYAEFVTGYGFGLKEVQQIRAELEKRIIPATALDMLASLQGVDYPDQTLFEKSIQARLRLYGENNLIRRLIFEIVDDQDLFETVAGGALRANQKWLDALKSRQVPASIIDGLRPMNGLFPDRAALRLAIESRLNAIAAGEFLKVIDETLADPRLFAAGATGGIQPTQAWLDTLVARNVPPHVVTAMRQITGYYPSKAVFRAVLDKQLNLIGESLAGKYAPYTAMLVAQAHKLRGYQPAPVDWSGNGCSCVRDDLAGQVYGFYPYWMSGQKQVVDFSLFSRVGFAGLGFNDDGKILQPEIWKTADTRFIAEARRYSTKLDLVIFRSEWGNWVGLSSERKHEVLRTLGDQIADLLTLPLDDFASRAKPYVAFGTTPRPVRGDGVTLHFDDFPADPDSVNAFRTFVRELAGRLSRERQDFSVNLMFRSSAIGTGIYQYSELLKLMDALRGGHKNVDGKLLVMLEEPTSHEKKALRQKIESGLHGEDRMRLLRDVVTVLIYDGVSKAQLADDIIYAKDNFAGIGFWPLPVAAEKQETVNQDINIGLKTNYTLADQGSVIQPASLCTYICPNRWLVRLLWDVFTLSIIVITLFYIRNCSVRAWVEDNYLLFLLLQVIPFVALTFALVFCDPDLKKISNGNGLAIFMAVAIIAYIVWDYRDRKQKANLP